MQLQISVFSVAFATLGIVLPCPLSVLFRRRDDGGGVTAVSLQGHCGESSGNSTGFEPPRARTSTHARARALARTQAIALWQVKDVADG